MANIIAIIVLILCFDIFLDSRYKDFKNEKEEKEIEITTIIVISVISVALLEIFNNFWIFIIPILITPTFIIPILIFLLRKSEAQKYKNITTIINKSNKTYENRENLLDQIDYMTGQEFENLLIEKILPLDGYTNINGTSYTGDYGVDIIMCYTM